MTDTHSNNDGRILHAHNPSYGINIMIWIILVSLTVLTIAIAGIDLGNFTLFVALLIAAVKSTYVISYFMHIKFEDLLFKIFFAMVVLVLFVVFVLTGFDVFFR